MTVRSFRKLYLYKKKKKKGLIRGAITISFLRHSQRSARNSYEILVFNTDPPADLGLQRPEEERNNVEILS